ncbi:MAG: acylphosphatase [Chitinophagaceae bacterium]
MKTIRLKITGKVQGVFYRQNTTEKAEKLNLTGTVRNCEDDSVEIIATGEEEQLAELVKWCWQGPPRAKVENIQAEELPLKIFQNFSIIRY